MKARRGQGPRGPKVIHSQMFLSVRTVKRHIGGWPDRRVLTWCETEQIAAHGSQRQREMRCLLIPPAAPVALQAWKLRNKLEDLACWRIPRGRSYIVELFFSSFFFSPAPRLKEKVFMSNISRVAHSSVECAHLQSEQAIAVLQWRSDHLHAASRDGQKKKGLFFPEKCIPTVLNCFEKGVRVSCLLSKTHPVFQKKGYFKKNTHTQVFEDRANLQAESENQPLDDIPPCWR